MTVLLSILYVLSPVDIIPEAMLGPLGFTDDALVTLNLIRKIFS